MIPLIVSSKGIAKLSYMMSATVVELLSLVRIQDIEFYKKTTSVNHVCPPRNRPSGPLFCVPHCYRPGGGKNKLLSFYSPHIRPYLWK
ncbi:hypothetical protein RRG08_007150 [Elysia crispata]|uniref:Uncharacterized protein n=1 Tax=Elysia crispata TaxID=231223 RepID=A0AAE1DVQ8_9GAST|nr:hypothetical protein RRG08_007150 [Elysia crispata]